MIVPADAREIVGQKVFIETTGETDEHRAASIAAPIIARFKERIRCARLTSRPFDRVAAEALAQRYRHAAADVRADRHGVDEAVGQVGRADRPAFAGV